MQCSMQVELHCELEHTWPLPLALPFPLPTLPLPLQLPLPLPPCVMEITTYRIEEITTVDSALRAEQSTH